MFKRRFTDATERIECRISGTYDPLIESTSPAYTEAVIVSSLLSSSYLIENTNASDGTLTCTCMKYMYIYNK